MADKTSKNPSKVETDAARRAATGEATSSDAAAEPSDQASASERIDRRIAELGDWRGKKLAEVRALIHEAAPEVVEEWKWRGAPVWSHDGILCVANAFKDKVKVTFYQGAHIPDPDGLFNSGLGGKQWRTIDLFRDDRLRGAEFKRLVRAAVDFNLAKEKASGGKAPSAAGDGAPSTAAGGDDPAADAEPKLLSGGDP